MYSCQRGTQQYQVQSGDSLWLIAQRHQTSIQAIEAVNPGIDRNNLFIGQFICIPQDPSPYQETLQEIPVVISMKEHELNNYIRLLWEQHVYWTRMVILSIAFDLPDAEYTTNRLLRNPKDFEEALIPFYGEAVAAQFAEFLTNHLEIAAELVKAAKAGNSTAAADAEKRWYDNADQIANFLGGINPYWSVEEWQRLLYNHLAMTKQEAVDILTNKFSESIDVLDNIELEALEMADEMTQGIVNQFPQYFM